MRQLIVSAVLGALAELGYLAAANGLDHLGANATVANLGGLAVDALLDYILQSLVFLGEVPVRNIGRFIVYRVFDTALRQSLYEIVRRLPSVRSYLEKDDRRASSVWNSHETHVRYIVTVFSFFVSYPVRKYLVFVKDSIAPAPKKTEFSTNS